MTILPQVKIVVNTQKRSLFKPLSKVIHRAVEASLHCPASTPLKIYFSPKKPIF